MYKTIFLNTFFWHSAERIPQASEIKEPGRQCKCCHMLLLLHFDPTQTLGSDSLTCSPH